MSAQPKLLILELWGLGDLAIASRLIEKASQTYEVTVLAKPYAQDLQKKLWPKAKVIPFVAPWTAFKDKYRLHQWPWPQLLKLSTQLRREKFDLAISGRWDPRDHAWMRVSGARKCIGFPRSGSQHLLHQKLPLPPKKAHRYDQWKLVGEAIDVAIPDWKTAPPQSKRTRSIQTAVVHTGAAQPVRVWPLERYEKLITFLENQGLRVQLICDTDQEKWWQTKGRQPVVPQSVTELVQQLETGDIFIGNDSGPGHLAAALDLATLTVFGPQLTEWFRPAHPQGMVVEGKQCEYKPCFDTCRFDTPHCMTEVTFEEVQTITSSFLEQFKTEPPMLELEL
jgi:ADP-heptose:LPS heptosyltransferase